MDRLAIIALAITLADGYVAPSRPQTSYGVPSQSGPFYSGYDGPLQFSSQFGSSSSSSNSLASSSSSSFQSSSQGANQFQQKPEIFKHIYVHVAPEDKEEPSLRPQAPLPPPRKHYKIIFIKTPEPPAASSPQILPQALDQEKTLVYVLLKQRDELADLVLPSVAPTEPSKPEVYFIKYKANRESIASSQQSGLASAISSSSSSSSNSQSAGSLDINTASGSFNEATGGYISGSSSSSSSSSTSLGTVNTGSSTAVHKPADSYGPPGYY